MLSRTLLIATLALVASVYCCSASEPEARTRGKPNRLAKESSAYLLQHAHNPVDWFPWVPEAFEKARKENKIVFLSIGYSSCHWCHVMERESFENAEVAKALNANFVCIKVDREERPDVDEVYMTALTVTGESGGWPLSMFLTPDGKPMFGATYIPPKDRDVPGGKILGFDSVLKKVLELHKDKLKEIYAQADLIANRTRDELDRSSRSAALVPLEKSLVAEAAESFEVDPEWGGLGSRRREFKQTKFPRVAVWTFLQRQAAKPGQTQLKADVERTLSQMALGGIYDHLGGGFHRYSTERTWTVPHFEKMLYDNAQLVELYAEAYRHNPDPLYKRIVAETLGFVAREMTSPDAGFYSALDADSNGKEGEFYVWSIEELKAVLGGGADLERFRKIFAAGEPNFEGKSYVLRLPKPLGELAKELKTTEAELLARLEGLKAKLLVARSKRPRPFLDTKIVTGWNGQMIAAYARAGQVFGDKAWIASAVRTAEFLLANLRDKEGRWLRTYGAKPGEKPTARINAFLDDYAFVAHAFLTLHDATGDKRWLDEAKQVTDGMIRWYGDAERGGFYFTAHDHEKLFARSKESYDGAQPSGNGMAARVLLALARKTGDARYRELARKTLQLFAGVLKTNPAAAPGMALALDEYLDAPAVGVAPLELINPVATGAGKKLKTSGDVVRGELTLEQAADGMQAFTVALVIDKPYHIYANPVGNKLLVDSETHVEVWRDGKKIEADVTYPKGIKVPDALVGEQVIYREKATIRGKVKAGSGPLEIRVRVQACDEKQCLAAASIKLTAK